MGTGSGVESGKWKILVKGQTGWMVIVSWGGGLVTGSDGKKKAVVGKRVARQVLRGVTSVCRWLGTLAYRACKMMNLMLFRGTNFNLSIAC